MDRFLSLPQAMEATGIKSRNTMKRLIREGHIEAERLPSLSGRGHWRIPESSLLSLVESKLQHEALAHVRGFR